MKFNVSSKALQGCTQAVSRIINPKGTLAVLSNFKLDLVGSQLSITASDGENFLSGRIEVTNFEGADGSACVDARSLVDCVKDLPEVGLEFDFDDNLGVKVSYQGGEFNFMAYPAEDYPSVRNEGEAEMRLSMPVEKVLRAIDYTIFAVGNDEIRPQMMGILWDIKDDHLVFVATDTRKLVKFADYSVRPGCEARFIAPEKSMAIVRNVFAKSEQIEVVMGDKGVTFESPEFTFNTRFLKGNFPDYDRVINQNNPYTLTVDRLAFLSAIRRISAFCTGGNGLVRFKIDPESITFKALETEMNKSAWANTACDYNGPADTVLGFSANYVAQILSALQSPEVLVKLADPSRPCIFLPSENQPDTEVQMLLMPMHVSEF